jgi:hypothetical protein
MPFLLENSLSAELLRKDANPPELPSDIEIIG